jgi:hypothetical protein
MRLLYVLPLVLLTACPELVVRFVSGPADTGADDSGIGGGRVDADGDGFSVEDGDCDDSNATIYPGAPEVPDKIDNDCDGEVDERDTGGRDTGGGVFDDSGFGGGGKDTGRGKDTGGWFKGDWDGDGWTVADGDCNDFDATVYPGAKELKDGIDNDCDGVVDGTSGGDTGRDTGGGGFGGGRYSDDDKDGYSEVKGDCDDTDPTIHPGAKDPPDKIDSDCDGIP